MDNCTQGSNGTSEKGATVSGDNRKWCRKSAWYARLGTFRKLTVVDGSIKTCDHITINSKYITADEIIKRWNSAIVNETSGSFRLEDDLQAKVKLKSCT